MFGQSDKISGEWTHGVFSSLWHRYNDVKRTNTWLICDGPVDAIWIENLNTVLNSLHFVHFFFLLQSLFII
jgi:dynein heavy chain, axonemal